jgi:hypothetical protein
MFSDAVILTKNNKLDEQFKAGILYFLSMGC